MSKGLEAIKYVNELIKNVEEYKNKTGIDKPTICISAEALIDIQQALFKLQKNENKALAFDYLVKHFNFKCEVDAMPNGEVWARFVSIQSKDDEGTWDTTAMANLVDYKEEYEFLEKMFGKDRSE